MSLRDSSTSVITLLKWKNHFLIHNLILIAVKHLIKSLLILLQWKIHIVIDICTSMMIDSVLFTRGSVSIKCCTLRLSIILPATHLFIISRFVWERNIVGSLVSRRYLTSHSNTTPWLSIVRVKVLTSLNPILWGAYHTWFRLKDSVFLGLAITLIIVVIFICLSAWILSLNELLLSIRINL